MWGLDMRRGLEPASDLHGEYSTDVFTDEAVDLIRQHNKSEPLFLYLAHAAVHSGNPYNPLAAPDTLISMFGNITDYYRQRFAGETLSSRVESKSKSIYLTQQTATDGVGPAPPTEKLEIPKSQF